jgi:hypothetical protein
VNAGWIGCIRSDIRVGELEGVGLFNDSLDAKPGVGRSFDVSGPINGAMRLKELKDGVSEEDVRIPCAPPGLTTYH